MAKLEFNKPNKKKIEEGVEADNDLYDMILSQTSEPVETDDSEDEEENEFAECDEINAKDLGFKLTKALREELEKVEYTRNYLRFKYRGETLEGVPLAEINPAKFVFNINGKMRAINLCEVIVL